MLVRAFEIHHHVFATVLPAADFEIVACLQREGVGAAGIEPDVQGIVDLAPLVAVVVGLEETRGRAGSIPGVGAFALEGVGDALVDARVVEDLDRAVVPLADENGDRHAPGTLARDHPIGPALNHAGDAVLALRRNPAGRADCRQRAIAQGVARPGCARRVRNRLVHRDEPLRRVAEDHRLLRAPGVRILVLEPAARDQHAGVDQRLDDGVVGVAFFAGVGEDALAGEARCVIGERTVLVDGVGDHGIDAARSELCGIASPDLEVLAAVAWRGMDEACAGIIGDVIAGEQRHGKIITVVDTVQGMAGAQLCQVFRGNIAQPLIFGDAGLLQHIGRQLVGEHQAIARLGPVVRRRVRHFVESVGDLRREADRAVARERPWSRRPNDDGGRVQPWGNPLPYRKLHPHLVRDIVFVLDLGLRQGGLLHHRPHHRLGAAIERAVLRELHQLARDLRLRRIAHRAVVMVPVADAAEPHELGALNAEPVLGKGAALAAEFDDGHVLLVLALGAVFLLDLPLDGKAMAVPARHEIGVVAEHLLRANHDVLEDFAERGADVDMPVGIGRTVMQDESRPAPRRRAQPLVEAELLPACEDFGLLLGKPGAHGKVGPGQK